MLWESLQLSEGALSAFAYVIRNNPIYREQVQELGVHEDRFLGMGVSVFGALKNKQGVLYKPIIQYMNEQWI